MMELLEFGMVRYPLCLEGNILYSLFKFPRGQEEGRKGKITFLFSVLPLLQPKVEEQSPAPKEKKWMCVTSRHFPSLFLCFALALADVGSSRTDHALSIIHYSHRHLHPAGRSMVSTTPMLLFISSAGAVRRAVGSFGPSVATAFLNAPTSKHNNVMPMATRHQHLSTRFMSTDAPAEEKTEEENAAIKAAREARK
jgi:hypothetical protein